MRLTYKWQAALVVSLGLFMAVLDNTIVNVALPAMQSYYHTSQDTITWVVTGYFLAQAAVIPVTGYLSDLIGSKSVFIGALVVFTAGSALCAVAPSEQILIASRVFQGIGGGALFPTAFAIVFRVFPPAERGPAGAVIGVPVLLAPAFGPTIGGYLTTTFNWNAIFFVNVPIGIIALILSALVLRGRAADREAHGEHLETAQGRRRFDILGLLLAMVGFTGLVYGITEAGTTANGWSDVTVDRFLIGSGIVLAIFIVNELLVSDPVMDLRLFLNYTFTMSNLLMWGVSAFLFGSLILLPFFFENIRGLSALSTGEILISQGVAAALATIIAGRFYNQIGPRILAVVGFIFITAGTYGFTNMSVTTTGADVQGWLILRGLGLGLTNIPLQTLALSVVSNRAMARASSLVNVTRQVAGAVGIAAITTYLTQQVTSHVAAVTTTFRTEQLASVQAQCVATFGRSPSVVTCVTDAARQYIGQHAFVLGLNDTFLVVTIATGVCVLLAVLVGRDPAVEAAKRAAARGEKVEGRAMVISE
jgi:EmrB/QacA subfamily drug resistance transporter